MLLATRVYRDCENSRVLGFGITDTCSNSYISLNMRDIRSLYKAKGKLVYNLNFITRGQIALENMNPNVGGRKWYSRSLEDGMFMEHYCVVTSIDEGLVSFIADTPTSGVIVGCGMALSNIAALLGVSIDKLRFYNCYIGKNDIGKTTINLYDPNALEYRIVLEKELDTKNNILGDAWTVRIANMGTNGIYAISLKNVKKEVKASIPMEIYHLDRFRGGVNNLIIEPSLKFIAGGCFKELKDLYTVEFKEGILSIPNECFINSRLEKVIISSTVKEIGEKAFMNCTRLKSPIITLARTIGNRAFYKTSITTIDLQNVTELQTEAFAYNKKLKKVKLGNKLKAIGHGAFRGCTSLEIVEIPESVEYIGIKAFSSCENLKLVRFLGDKSRKVYSNTFPKDVKIEYSNKVNS